VGGPHLGEVGTGDVDEHVGVWAGVADGEEQARVLSRVVGAVEGELDLDLQQLDVGADPLIRTDGSPGNLGLRGLARCLGATSRQWDDGGHDQGGEPATGRQGGRFRHGHGDSFR
jgi:hypothetical protein